jgi:hypothetical protein
VVGFLNQGFSDVMTDATTRTCQKNPLGGHCWILDFGFWILDSGFSHRVELGGFLAPVILCSRCQHFSDW